MIIFVINNKSLFGKLQFMYIGTLTVMVHLVAQPSVYFYDNMDVGHLNIKTRTVAVKANRLGFFLRICINMYKSYLKR